MESEEQYKTKAREIHFKSGKTLNVSEDVVETIKSNLDKGRFIAFGNDEGKIGFIINIEEIEFIL